MLPIGWVVMSPKGGPALFLEKPRADEFAAKVHGAVDPVYSGTQISGLLDTLEQTRAAHIAAVAGEQGEGGFACSRH